jgi:Amt family ammonium transporter
MTISIGVVAYYLIGFALMFGPDIAGLIGAKGFALTQRDLFDFGIPLDAFWFFQAVFAATCATIVSGAMAERTKFSAYLFFCILICSVTYPVIGHWIWGGGWLSNLGFIDFAGSTVVHGVGGVTALIGAWMVGARTGKYTQDGKVHAIPGHSIPLGALGVLLLWFGWFGFNPGSTISGTTPDIASIAVTTLLAGAAATITSMLFSWVKYGKPDVSLTLNGCLAGLVAITAGTAAVTPNGALVIGGIAGVLMILAVEFFDRVAKIDDPVGAISVHGVCGSFGTIMVGLFAKEGGLLYGGGIKLLGVQTLGVTAALGFAAVMGLIVFGALKATIGIRVSEEEESNGLDIGEHGISAYTDPSSTANIF